jgi:hypothetical protein
MREWKYNFTHAWNLFYTEERIQIHTPAVLTSTNWPLLLSTQDAGWSPGWSESDDDDGDFTRIIQYVAYMLCLILQHVIISTQSEVYSWWDAERNFYFLRVVYRGPYNVMSH